MLLFSEMEGVHLKKKRGPYRRYLIDAKHHLPRTSYWRRKKNAIPPKPAAIEDMQEQPSPKLSPSFTEESPCEHSIASTSNSYDVLASSEVNSDSTDPIYDSTSSDESEPTSASSSCEETINLNNSSCDESNDLCPDFDTDLNIDSDMFKPLYDNANITVCGAYCAILEFQRACRLPFATISMLLSLLQLLCPSNNQLPQSLYKFKKFFEKFSSPYQRNQYCSDCLKKFKKDQKRCNNQQCRYSEPSTLISFNPEMAIIRVLKRNWCSLVDSSLHHHDVLKDIHDGSGYRNTQHGIVFNTDGISPYKSSRKTIWPILIALTDLPPNIRMNKENIVTVALWEGESKPPMDILFKPLISLLSRLSMKGLTLTSPTGEQIVFKFQPLFGSFDLVAKAPILNMHQFNGKNGCAGCLHPGEWKHGSRYYLPHTKYICRNNESVKRAAIEAENTEIVVDGIKGKSVLTDLVDLVHGAPIDYMHCVLEGVLKWLVEKWFNSTNHGSAFYIGGSVKKVDTHLLQQTPPHDFSRVPRSIEKHRKFWKASEYRNFLLYYSLPILASILPPLYFHHYSLLVSSMHILLQSKLAKEQVKAAEIMLQDFYQLLPELYGEASCTLNAHSLTHLTMYVKLWGPLWTHSLFGYENMNGHITSLIHSKRKICEQLLFSIGVCQTLGILADQLIHVENEATFSFIAPLSSFFSHHRNKMTLILPGIYSVGKLQSHKLLPDEILSFEEEYLDTDEVLIYHRLYCKGTMLQSTAYQGKRDSSVCCYTNNGELQYGIIKKFVFMPPVVLLQPLHKSGNTLLSSVGQPCRPRLQRYADTDLLSVFVIQVEGNSLPLRAIPIKFLCAKCIKVSISELNRVYVIRIPNNYEHH